MSNVRNARVALVQFYFDIVEDYKVYQYLPHRAVEFYDVVANKEHDVRCSGAACFMLAQKSIDSVLIPAPVLASLFVTDEAAIRNAEVDIFTFAFFKISPKPPEHRFHTMVPAGLTPEQHNNLERFFHLSVFESDPLPVRISAAIEAMRMHHRLDGRTADLVVVDCARRVHSRTVSDLGIRLALIASS